MTSRNRRYYLCRRTRQADYQLRRAAKHMAVILRTLEEQHPECTPWVRDFLQSLDLMRVKLFWWQRFILGGTERGLWVPGDLEIILAEAKPEVVPDRARRRSQSEKIGGIFT